MKPITSGDHGGREVDEKKKREPMAAGEEGQRGTHTRTWQKQVPKGKRECEEGRSEMTCAPGGPDPHRK